MVGPKGSVQRMLASLLGIESVRTVTFDSVNSGRFMSVSCVPVAKRTNSSFGDCAAMAWIMDSVTTATPVLNGVVRERISIAIRIEWIMLIGFARF